MAGYCGTPAQQRLQRVAEEAIDWARTVPGAANFGRLRGTDDIDRLGWQAAFDIVAEDGAFGFRMWPRARTAELDAAFGARGCRVDYWETFIADAATARAATAPILSGDPPGGLDWRPLEGDPQGPMVARAQAFLLEAGITPFSGSLLLGAFGPAVTLAALDPSGALAAVAHAYLPHNRHSPFHRHAWCGMVAVSPANRGAGLGRIANARIVEAATGQLGAAFVYELVSETNVPSRRMVAASGLTVSPFVTAVAVPVASGRLTR